MITIFFIEHSCPKQSHTTFLHTTCRWPLKHDCLRLSLAQHKHWSAQYTTHSQEIHFFEGTRLLGGTHLCRHTSGFCFGRTCSSLNLLMMTTACATSKTDKCLHTVEENNAQFSCSFIQQAFSLHRHALSSHFSNSCYTSYGGLDASYDV